MAKQRHLWSVVSLLFLLLLCPQAFAVDYYVDAVGGNDSNAGTSAGAAWKTLDKVRSSGVVTYGTGVAGNRVFLSGTFQGNAAGTVINKLKLRPVDNCTIAQWAGMPKAIIRGDITPTWSAGSAAYRWFTTLPQADPTLGETDGISDYVASVVYNWDASVDSLGRNYGHLQRAANAAAVTGGADGAYLYFYEPTTRRLDICLATGDDQTKAAWCRGNVDGIEIGTPTYESFPAHDSALAAGTLGNFSRPVYNFTLDGITVMLFCDSGKGGRASVVSIGYTIRIADGVYCIVRNCTTRDSGYHALMFVGDACYGNLAEDCVFWGGAPNATSGNSFGLFYSGPGAGLFPIYANIDKCVGRRLTGYKYWHLGVDGNPMALDAARASMAAGGCDGFICHTNARGLEEGNGTASTAANGDGVTVVGSKFRITHTSSKTMYTGERVTIVDSTGCTPALPAGTYTVTNVSTTVFEIDGFAASSATAAAGAHWYSESNQVLDAQFEDCTIYESGKISDSTLCMGSAFLGGSRSRAPYNEYDWSTYPTRYLRCKVFNGSKNLGALSDAAGFKQCRLQMDRAGLYAEASASPTSGVMGSTSGEITTFNRMLFEACEITANMASGTNAHAIFQLHANNKLYFLNSTIYSTGIRSTGEDRLFVASSGDTAKGVWMRGNVLGFRNFRGSNLNYLFSGPNGAWWRQYGSGITVKGDLRNNKYFNISTGSFTPFAGDGTPNTQARFQAQVDPSGVFLGQDASTAYVNPLVDMSGKSVLQTVKQIGGTLQTTSSNNGRGQASTVSAAAAAVFTCTDTNRLVTGEQIVVTASNVAGINVGDTLTATHITGSLSFSVPVDTTGGGGTVTWYVPIATSFTPSFGINDRGFSNDHGSWQYGPTGEVYRRIINRSRR